MTSLGAFTRKFAFPLWHWYAAGILFLALTNYVTLKIPLLAKTIVNAVERNQVDGSLQTVALSIIGLGLLTIIIRASSRIFIFWPGRTIEANSKSYLFSRMLRLSQGFYQKYGMGELISRLSNDVGLLRAFFAFGFLQFLNFIFLFAFTISMMLSIHRELTFICLAPILVMLGLMRFLMSYMHRISLENQKAIGRLTNRVTEAFVNVHVIQSNSAEPTFQRRTDIENEDVYRTNLKAVLLRTILFPLMTAFTNLSQVAILFYGGYEIIHGRLSVGDILAFNVYIAYLGFPISALGIVISLYQRSRAAIDRISGIETAEPEASQMVAQTCCNTEALLSIKDLSYAFPDGARALESVSLDIARGRTYRRVWDDWQRQVYSV